MATETLAIGANSTPQEWTVVNATSHKVALESDLDARTVVALAPNLEDNFTMEAISAPSFWRVTNVRFQYVLAADQASASWYGIESRVYSGAALQGSTQRVLSPDIADPTPITVDVAVDMSQSSWADHKIQFESVGAGWPFGAAVIVIHKLTFVVTHTKYGEKSVSATGKTEKTIASTSSTEKAISSTSFTEKVVS